VDIDDCAVHGHEPVPEGCYLVCGECRHAFATADELVRADQAVRESLEGSASAGPWPVDEIDVCPHCTHDL
jgi:hypothetical protein